MNRRIRAFLLACLAASFLGCLNPAAGGQRSDKDILSYGFTSPASSGVIDTSSGSIAVSVPHGTAVSGLAAVFTVSDGAAAAVGGIPQVSGTTVNDFSGPVAYVVTAEDGSTRTYTVNVTAALSSEKDLLSFGLVSPAVTGTINASSHTVAVFVPFGTSLGSLVPVFTVSEGARVEVSGIPQVSGTTAHSFSSPVQYTIIAEDGSTAYYLVEATIGTPSADADLSALSVTGAGALTPTFDAAATLYSVPDLGYA